jgi:hypothetical protein
VRHFRRSVRRIVVGAAAAVIAVAVPAYGARTYGASISGCTSSTGVVVIVDFSHWGGAIERGCAPAPDTGLDALHDAGFSTAGTAQYGDAFVCRIDNHPSAGEQACASTPPANAYWAYYHARWTDSGWTYNSVGAASTHPAPGSIEAWAFGARVLPGVGPAAAVATVTTTPPPAPTTAYPQPPPDVTSPPAHSSGSHSAGDTTPRSGSGPAAITPVDGSPTAGAAPGPTSLVITKAGKARAGQHAVAETRGVAATPTTTLPGPHVIERASAPAAAHEASGSPFATIATVLALIAAGTIGALVVRTRRRQAA